MRYALLFLALLFAAPASAQTYTPQGRNCGTACYVAGDPNVPVFTSSTAGGAYPSAETPTNFSMITGPSIAQPAQQTGPSAATQTFTGSVTGNTLTIGSTLTGGALLNMTQLLRANLGGCGATPSSTTPGNCPVITGLLTGNGVTIGSTYSFSGPAATTQSGVSISTIPVGLNETPIAAWDSVSHRQWDNGFVMGCVLANKEWGIAKVDFYLDPDGVKPPITATATTTNSESGAPDYCWTASTLLFSGHNGVHVVSAVIWPVVGWPIVMQSNQTVTAGASTNIFTVRGFTPTNINTGTRFFYITNSSDPATFPNASTDNATNGATRTTNFRGFYCVVATNPDNFTLTEGTWTARTGVGPNPTPSCNYQMVGGGTIGTNTLTLTNNPFNQGGGQVIVGQTITGSGLSGSNTVTSVTGSLPALTVTYSGTALSSSPSGQTYTFAGTIPSTASGATFTLTSFHAGGMFERVANQNNGSDFFIVNSPFNGAQALETTAYASLTGSNANPATAAFPAATLQGAMLAVTPTNGKNLYFANTSPPYATTQALATAAGCTTFTLAGNTSGVVPFQVGMPVKYDGQTVANGVFVMDGIYFVQSAASNALTLAATPGGPCINDTALVAAAVGGTTYATTASLVYDYAETTLLAQHTGSGVNYFAYGDFTGVPTTSTGGIVRLAVFGYATIGWDPATATFDNVAINTVGGSSTNSFNPAPGLGINNLRVNIKGVMPTATVYLTQGIAKGATIGSISFLASDLPANFPLIFQNQAKQGTHPTQVIPNGVSCMPTSGGNQTVMASASAIAGTTQTLTLINATGSSGGTNNTTPTLPVATAIEECPVGTPVLLSGYWNYESLNNLWLDNTTMVAPTNFLSSTSTPGAIQLGGVGVGVVIATNSSVFSFAQGMSAVGYVANSLIWGGGSAGTKGGTWTLVNSLMDKGGPQAYTEINSVNNFNSYGIEEPVLNQTATATLALSGTTATLTGISGAIYPGMLFGGSCSPGLPALLETMQYVSDTPTSQTWTVSGAASIASCSVTLQRSIWHLAPPGNTTPGNYYPLPRLDPNMQAMWICNGGTVINSNQIPVWGFDPKRSTVIVNGTPSSPCLFDGTTQLVLVDGFHTDLNTQLAQSNGFQTGWNISGLTIVNSMGYGWYVLQNTGALSVTYNSYLGNSYIHNYQTAIGQGTYGDLSLFGSNVITNRNFLARYNDFGLLSTPITAVVQNGTFVSDGNHCGAPSAPLTGIGASISGYIIRNTGWPGQGSLPPGNC